MFEQLHAAIEEGNEQKFAALLSNADLESLTLDDAKGHTLAHLIVRLNRPVFMQLFIGAIECIDKSGLSILKQPDNNGYSPLEYCYFYSAPKVAEILQARTQLDKAEVSILAKNYERLKRESPRRLDAKLRVAFFAAAANDVEAFNIVANLRDEFFSHRTKEGWSLLHFAVFNHSTDFLKSFFENWTSKIDIEVKDNEGNTPFLVAIERNPVEFLQYLMAQGCNIYGKNYQGDNGIMIAAQQGQLETIQFLLGHQVEIAAVNSKGENALLLAAKKGHASVVKFLRKAGVSPNLKDNQGKSAFYRALEYGFIEVAELLVDMSTQQEKDEALIAAVIRGDLLTATWLVNHGASLSAKDAKGNTPFLLAVAGGSLPLVEYFLSVNPAVLDDENEAEDNALYVAIANRHKHIVEFFLKRKDFPHPQKNAEDQSPLLASAAMNALDLVEIFYKAGYSPVEQDEDGDTALHLALSSKNYGRAVEYFLKEYPELRARKNDKGQTPLHLAIIHQKNSLFSILAKNPRELEERDEEGNTPLLLAVASNNFDAIRYLLKEGVDILAKNNKGDSVVTITSLNAFPESIRKKFFDTYQIDEQEYQHRRRLYFIFGGEKLNDVLAFPQGKVKLGSGSFEDGVQILKNHFENFLAEKHPELAPRFQMLLEVLENFKCYQMPQGILSDLDSRGFVLQATGFIRHAILATLKDQKDGTIKLSFAERGARVGGAPLLHPESKRFAAVRTITFPKEKCKEVVELLFRAKNISAEDAMDILFNQIPKFIGEPYQFLNIYQKKFMDICFYSNPKTGLYEQFIDVLGSAEGRLFYKEFELYTREKELRNYEVFWQENHKEEKLELNPIIVKARDLIGKREEEVRKLQPG